MMQISGMEFSRKIFLAIFGTAAFTAVVICLVLYGTLSKNRVEDFESSYIDHMNLLAKALGRIEESQSRIALNAAQVLKLKDQQALGRFTETELKSLNLQLGVSQINIYNVKGIALESSDDAKPASLFSAFPNLIDSKSVIYQTSLMRGSDSQVGHHTIVSSADGKRFIEVSIYFDAVTQLLREMAQHDEDNLSIELLGPHNENLGHIQRDDFKPTLNLEQAMQWNDGAHWSAGKMIVLTSMKSESKGRLIATISAQSLEQELRKIQQTLIAVGAILLLLSWWLSQVLTKTLLRKVESIRGTLTQITRTQDYSQRVLASNKNPLKTDQEVSRDELEDLGNNLNKMLETLQSHQSQLLEAERDKARTQIAAQVAHDIRSPLMSMNMALSQIESSQLEPLAILKSAVARVAGIVQKLSSISAKPEEESTTEAPKLTLMEPLIANVFNEHLVRKKATQSLKLNGLNALPRVWSVVQVSELQTALSNMINNAFEAGATEVALNFSEQPKEWILEIKDNGKGIPANILANIFERSFTHGKETGTGLGLFQAKAAVEWSGGTLKVTTAEERGTSFALHMPREKNPNWLPAFIEVGIDQPICFVDDDSNVLEAWRNKAATLGLKNAQFFASMRALENWNALSMWPENALLVIDQNLGENKKGTEILSELGIGKRAYLCTSEFDEKWIQDQVRKLNSWLILKPWISQFELKVRI